MTGTGDERPESRQSTRARSEESPATDTGTPAPGNPRRKRRKSLQLLKWTAIALVVLVLVAAAALFALNGGAADGYLAVRVRSALQTALGPDLDVTIRGAGIRFASLSRIEMRAKGVEIIDKRTREPVTAARSISLDVSTVALLQGGIDVGALDVDGVTFDPSAFGEKTTAFDFAALRVDALSRIMNAAFAGGDRVLAVLGANHAGIIHVTDTKITSAGANTVPVTIKSLTMLRTPSGGFHLDGTMDEAGTESRLTATAVAGRQHKHIQSFRLKLNGLDTAPFLIQKTVDGVPAAGVSTRVDISVSATRDGTKAKPTLDAAIQLAPGKFYADSTPSPIRSGHINLDYDFDKQTIEINHSELMVGDSRFPFSGGIIDLSNLSDNGEQGFGVELLSNSSVSAPSDSDLSPLPFSGKIFAKYFKKENKLVVDQMVISTPVGSLAGSLQVVGGGKSPEISFVATIDKMRTRAIKQLWPYWLAVHAREWVLNNLYGGDITNGSIKLFIPKDKIAENAGDMHFGPSELQVGFDYKDARLNIAGDIPPLRNAKGHFGLKGTRLEIALAGGTTYFPSGRSVTATNGTFSIPDTDRHPLMADLDIVVAGKADAVAELVSYKPIDALQRTDYKPADFNGDVISHVQATFGLLREQNPPKPVWKVDATLKNVDLAPPVDGHAFHDLRGTLKVDPEKAALDTDASVDGFPMHVLLTEPFGHDSTVQRQRVISAKLGNAARKALLPGLNDILDGPVDMRMTRTGDGTQDVTADLSDASVHVPGLGWTKGRGIAAKATFSTEDENGHIAVRDFDLEGGKFSVSGSLEIADNTLASASFPEVKLSPSDHFAVDIKRSGAGYAVDLDGSSVDLRGLIKQIKGEGGLSGSADGVPLKITARAKLAYGFNQQQLSGLKISYSGRGGQIDSLDAKAVTKSGRALVASVTPASGGSDLTLTCGDAGAVAGFADIYGKLEGGLLNIRLHRSGHGPYRGGVDMRNFSVKNEERLNSIVNSRTGRSGQSLRDTVKEPLNTSTPSFQRASANITLGSDYLKVSKGVVRGVQIGSTFQGTVFDGKGNMNVTGTFMPAYGLNRLFADVPIVGVLLGNGRDRGLFGITYRLTGKLSGPKIEVNPLSIIAPGVFRQIFEY